MGNIHQWLEDLGLGKYAEVFAENEIDFEVLPELEEADLEKIGLALGPRKKLLKAIREMGGPRAVGTPQEPPVQPSSSGEAERRQLTVMFCDLVGSTALSEGMDPEEYRKVIGAYQGAATSAIQQYDGYIARYMGDGLLVYFGYPQAHEDDAERAVRAGLGVVDAISGVDLQDQGDL
jgi:class 3 adenylate cyclase